MEFYAHSGEREDHKDWQLLAEHCNKVGNIAAENAKYFNSQVIAECIGKLHDLGKYSVVYQKRLHGGKRIDHSTAGARIAVETWGKANPVAKLMAYCIAGHHAGLANGIEEGENRSTLQSRLALEFGRDIPEPDMAWTQELSLPERLPFPPLSPAKKEALYGFQFAFFIRMLYSCLVDADFLDTEAFYSQWDKKPPRRGEYPALSTLQTALHVHLKELEAKARKKHPGPLNTLRSSILKTCRQKAITLSPGLFTLTVPTGGGKTLTSMAFSLEHALQHKLRRVIYVIPFTSIIEQNAQEFRKAFGEWGNDAVLEHHSSFDNAYCRDETSRDKLRLAQENWDYPVIVTTAVQFFESLFSDRSSRCRKLHNITGSVIILDEAQVLPLPLLRPIMAAIDELARNYQCSIVLCTATQPALLEEKGFHNGLTEVRELAPNPEQLFQKLQRVTIKHIGLQTDEQLCQHIREKEQVLIIVNNRRHARFLYDAVKDLDGTFLLTTLLCAKHRSIVLEKIRYRLKEGKPCRVLSTSLIEAGVDVDFPCVMRAEAGLDSIAQAAGRCNREGSRSPGQSEVLVFTPEEQWKSPPELSAMAAAMREVVRSHKDDLLSPQAIERYFSQVYWQQGGDLDRKQLLRLHAAGATSLDFSFQTIARLFQMIESHLIPVIVEYDEKAKKLVESLRYAEKTGGLARELQPYTVQIPQKALEELHSCRRVEVINKDALGQQFYAIIGRNFSSLYDKNAGLSWDNPAFLSSESLVL